MNATEALEMTNIINESKAFKQYEEIERLITTTCVKGNYSLYVDTKLYPIVKNKLLKDGFRCIETSPTSTKIFWS